MIALLTILCLCVSGYGIGKAVKEISAVKLLVFSFCSFFFLYTLVSAAFFWIDVFSFLPVLLCCLVLELGAVSFLLYRELKSGKTLLEAAFCKISFNYRRYAIPMIIALLALPFVFHKFELYSMGQDQGTYQVKALALLAYDTHNYMEMEEFNKLDTPEEKQKYLDFVYSQNNLYLPRVIEETDTDATHFDRIVGTIHGLPTYSALLALWGAVFGYANMIGVQTLLYLCLVFLAYFTMENIGLRRKTSFFLTALLAFSPIVVWGAKSSLTEISLTLVFTAFLYCMTAKGMAKLAWIPLTVFAFLHISIYVFMPILVIVLFWMYFQEQEKGWLMSVIGTLIGYTFSALWSFAIAPYYSYGNYNVLWKISRQIINEGNIIPVIFILCTLLSAAAIFLMTKKGMEFTKKLTTAMKESSRAQGIWAWGVRALMLVSVLFFVYKGILTAPYSRYFEYLQIGTYTYMTGLLLIPFLYLCLLLVPKKTLACKYGAAFFLLFIYCVVAYSSFMRLDILFYYYYARYVTIFLPVVFLLVGMLLEQIAIKESLKTALLALALLSFLPYDKGLLTQKDHTRCEWEVLGDVCEDITNQDAFIVGPEEQQIVFIFPVKLLTGCDVYYADENLRGQIGKLSQRYQNIYYLDYDGALEEKMLQDDAWQDGALSVKKVYTNWNHLSYLDYFNITNPLTPLPLNYVEYRLKLSMHEISRNS